MYTVGKKLRVILSTFCFKMSDWNYPVKFRSEVTVSFGPVCSWHAKINIIYA